MAAIIQKNSDLPILSSYNDPKNLELDALLSLTVYFIERIALGTGTSSATATACSLVDDVLL